MSRWIAWQLEGLDFFFFILAETVINRLWIKKILIVVEASAEAVHDFPLVLEIVFSLCFSYGEISFFGGHIFGSNQDRTRFFYRSAFEYFSPCEGFYRVSSTPLFFIRPGKVAYFIHGARRWVQRHFVLAEKSAAQMAMKLPRY